ncbi:hypothetical protein CHLRE_12g492650v5 [Chlamydomonas reinhardtii]|uniref:FAS1 domain-containing protein n=1 Tax=Chlamydomonas reinhardtii TaxID=3055 RepID=A0A2K3D1W6_CHLRE|nr:uncharacterized protein CHLRE_12g492650v5 [Chlamydomonas reinhardtii]PNW74524.1 hypothetical protein CHLRE_12g492650v5 [Chlamydomonas reinhardtii]
MARWTRPGASTILVASCLLLAVAGSSAQTILQAIQSANLTLLAAGLQVADLATTLNSTTGPNITLFAPSDDALLAMTAALNTTPNALLTLGPKVAPVFTYHAITTPLLAADIPTGDTPYATLNTGLNLTVSKAANGSVVVRALGSDANVIRTDITAGGAVVHVIDSVLLPFFLSVASAATRTPQLSSLLSAVASNGLAPALSNPNLNVTVFAPVNDAFNASSAYLTSVNASITDVLTYHVATSRVLNGSEVTASPITLTTLNSRANLTVARDGNNVVVTPVGATAATVLAANIPVGLDLTTGGPRTFVHLVNAVLLPFYTTVANAAERAGLTTLVAAVAASDPAFLAAVTDPTFRGTILAPSNAAFAATLASLNVTAAQLLADKDNLRRILNAHIIPNAAVFSNQLSNNQTVNTTGGALLTVSIGNGIVRFNAAKSSAKVVAADVSIGNGRAVVHVIDRVLLPADLTLPTPYVTVAGAAQAANLSTLLAAVTASDASFLTTLTDPDFNGTVLAPTNAAFTAALTALGVNATQLLADKDNLRRILNAHIITPGAVRSSQLVNNQNITTLDGVLTVRINGTGVFFVAAKSTAKVVTPDVIAGNAVVHTIDFVLLPASVTLTTGGSGGGGSGGGGAAGMASPSVLTLLSSALAFLALFAFGRF